MDVKAKERLLKRNEKARNKRVSETVEEKKKRCASRNERDRSRRKAKCNEVSFASIETVNRKRLPSKNDSEDCKRQKLDQRKLNQRERRKKETPSERAARLARVQERLDNETSQERAYRSQHMSELQKVRLQNEIKEVRANRLHHLSMLQKERLQQETDRERDKRLQNLSDNQKQRLALESDDERTTRNLKVSNSQKSAARETSKITPHLPSLEEESVKAKMKAFHEDLYAIKSPTCTTCMEKFPGLRVNSHSFCLRCSRDKKSPKMFSAENNMHPGEVPPELQVFHIVFANMLTKSELLIS